MSSLIDSVEVERTIKYQGFCSFEIYPLEGHDRIIYEAKIMNEPVIILSGKLHMYEGYNLSQCSAPLQYVNENYNIDQWIITSASGALQKGITVGEWYKVSSFMTLEHILGMSIQKSYTSSCKTQTATYAYQKGPALGTVAEYKMLLKFDADLVGMSIAPELIYLNSIKANSTLYSLPVCTYHPISYDIQEPSHQQVIEIAKAAVPKLVTILSSLISTS